MRFNIPQFIETEFKLIGFLTVKQFLICLFSGVFLIVIYSFVDIVLFIFIALPVTGMTILFTFYKVNGVIPFYRFLIIFFQKINQPKTRIWQREIKKIEKFKEKKEEKEKPLILKEINKESLSKIALTLDTGGRYKE